MFPLRASPSLERLADLQARRERRDAAQRPVGVVFLAWLAGWLAACGAPRIRFHIYTRAHAHTPLLSGMKEVTLRACIAWLAGEGEEGRKGRGDDRKSAANGSRREAKHWTPFIAAKHARARTHDSWSTGVVGGLAILHVTCGPSALGEAKRSTAIRQDREKKKEIEEGKARVLKCSAQP